MAWKDEGTHYTWDVTYTSRTMAARRAEDLAKIYRIITDLHPDIGEEGPYIEIITRNTITEEHSVACRCEKCVPL